MILDERKCENACYSAEAEQLHYSLVKSYHVDKDHKASGCHRVFLTSRATIREMVPLTEPVHCTSRSQPGISRTLGGSMLVLSE